MTFRETFTAPTVTDLGWGGEIDAQDTEQQ